MKFVISLPDVKRCDLYISSTITIEFKALLCIICLFQNAPKFYKRLMKKQERLKKRTSKEEPETKEASDSADNTGQSTRNKNGVLIIADKDLYSDDET